MSDKLDDSFYMNKFDIMNDLESKGVTYRGLFFSK